MSKNLVVKSNALVNASYNLGLVEQRLILLAIIEARASGKGVTPNDTLVINASSYMNNFDTNRNGAYQALKEAVNNIFERQFSFYEKTKDGDRIVRTRWVSRIAYIDDNATVELTFAPDVAPLITLLEKNFTSYDLEQVAYLNSKYAVRLYEIIIAWRSQGKTPTISVQELRERLGVSDNEYQKMELFKRKVLDFSVKQINTHTDIDATYTQQKSGRKITGFTFEFKYKKGRKPKHEIPKILLNAPNATTSNNKSSLTKKPTLETLTELERKVVAEANAYADKINASPSHRQNLVKKALDDNKKLEQENIKTQEAEKAKQQADEQAFKEFWAKATHDDKKILLEYAYKANKIGYHGRELKKALETNDFSTVEKESFFNSIFEYLKGGYLKHFNNQSPTPPADETPILPNDSYPVATDEPEPKPDPKPVPNDSYPVATDEPIPIITPPQKSLTELFNSYSSDEQEAIKDYTTWYLDINHITDPKKVREVKKMAIENRWGIANNGVKLVDDSVDPNEFAF